MLYGARVTHTVAYEDLCWSQARVLYGADPHATLKMPQSEYITLVFWRPPTTCTPLHLQGTPTGFESITYIRINPSN